MRENPLLSYTISCPLEICSIHIIPIRENGYTKKNHDNRHDNHDFYEGESGKLGFEHERIISFIFLCQILYSSNTHNLHNSRKYSNRKPENKSSGEKECKWFDKFYECCERCIYFPSVLLTDLERYWSER